MTEVMILLLVLGAFIGIGIGRWWAERQRALSDMRKVWDNRRTYRGG
ncbi:MAG TPA: hypothetical protein VNA11_06380 [Pseudonocardia sp.]|jgi:hypothetical protein|nr:hypothetical protein [Pseudonocardia sp.]